MVAEPLELLDWKRRVFALYEQVRASQDPAEAWSRWRAIRDDLFAKHPSSPLPADDRERFAGLPFFEYDPAARVVAEVEQAEPRTYEIATSGDGAYSFTRFGIVASSSPAGRRSSRSTGSRATAAASSCRFATRPAAPRPTAPAATCWTASRAPTSGPATAFWSATSTSPTTRPAPTTRSGCARWRRRRTGWRCRSGRVSATQRAEAPGSGDAVFFFRVRLVAADRCQAAALQP